VGGFPRSRSKLSGLSRGPRGDGGPLAREQHRVIAGVVEHHVLAGGHRNRRIASLDRSLRSRYAVPAGRQVLAASALRSVIVWEKHDSTRTVLVFVNSEQYRVLSDVARR